LPQQHNTAVWDDILVRVMVRARTRNKRPETAPADNGAPPRYICVHGHFYQPPRENPWLETVEIQDSAAPYHDWNDRITAECYAPNGASRIQNKKNEIIRIVNNYSRMSFNFGPTLLSWLEEFAPRTYRMILDADVASAQRYSGHGSAVAQVYNHIIMPLASERDARTQIRWGIADFEHRFGRKPEGMWLAETAVSRSVLDLMAQEGIKFTILAPHQCARVRPLSEEDAKRLEPVYSQPQDPAPRLLRRATDFVDGSDEENDADEEASTASAEVRDPIEHPWLETPNAIVDTTRSYVVQLDEGRSIGVFFYNGPASRAIAFEGLLNSGEVFARRLLSNLRDDKGANEPQMVHVATDGESYGHHHRHGEMALSFALHTIEEQQLARLTNYGEFLALHPPQFEAEVVDDSSWSCSHGVERWRSDCGCNGGKPGWNQKWRGPLRHALDLLRDRTAPMAEELAAPLLNDLWAARDAYIEVVLDRSPDSIGLFLDEHATHELSETERVTVLELLELQRHTQLMYTSCGWFFDELSGIETVQVIAYAGRVIQLAQKLFGDAPLFGDSAAALEHDFLEVLALAESNVPELRNGAEIYRKLVLPKRVDLDSVGAHYAISSMFRAYPDAGQIFCFDVQRCSSDMLTSGRGRVALGQASLRSRITEETEAICFAVLHLGDQNLSAAVKRADSTDDAAWLEFTDKARGSLRRANLPELIRLIDEFFGGTLYSLTSLFADEQHRILQSILNQTLSEVEGSLMRIYEEHATLLDFLGEANITAPPALALTAGFAINASLRHALEADTYDSAEVSRLLRRATIDHVQLDRALLSFTADKRMKRAMVRLETAVDEQNAAVLHETLAVAESLRTLPMDVNLWQAQNIWNDMLHRADAANWTREWRDGFRKLGTALNISVDDLVVENGVPIF
jgi:alpha-amylase/alpha-mannosidase (GH57 family)